jgi:Domain of Unknown Function (DUF1080)
MKWFHVVFIQAAFILMSCAAPSDQTRQTEKTAAPPGSTSTPATKHRTPEQILNEAAAQLPAQFEGAGWNSMFDGKSLKGWKETAFAGHGGVECRQGLMVLNMGDPFTGVNWTNDFPKMNYEIALEAMRVMGSDFFCGLTVPVGTNFCSLIVGGWGGSLLGLSSLDGMDASENETTHYINFQTGRWYRLRLRVTSRRIEGWLDDEKVVDVVTTDKTISLRPGEIEMSKPLGLASWETTAALRGIQWRSVTGPAGPAKRH